MSKVQKEHVAHEQLHGGGSVEEPAEGRAAEERHRDESGVDEPATENVAHEQLQSEIGVEEPADERVAEEQIRNKFNVDEADGERRNRMSAKMESEIEDEGGLLLREDDVAQADDVPALLNRNQTRSEMVKVKKKALKQTLSENCCQARPPPAPLPRMPASPIKHRQTNCR